MKLGMTVNVAPAVIDKDKMLEFAKEYDDVPLHTDEEEDYRVKARACAEILLRYIADGANEKDFIRTYSLT